jgi:rhodanese-related sulfurtransferase
MFNLFKKIFGQATDLSSLVQNGATIVDVRTVAEYKTGHINGSVNIPLDQLQSRLKELQGSSKPVITVCRSGNRSAMARRILQSAGIDTYNGGAWNLLQLKLK